jgi:hypothetical protein
MYKHFVGTCFTLILFCFSHVIHAGGVPPEFLIGKYLLIGKAIDSQETYQGKMEIYSDKDLLRIKRSINGTVVYGTAAIERAEMADGAEVLRLRFNENGMDVEEACLMRVDLDNYARISCYLYYPGKGTDAPGLEAMFNDHTAG